TKTQQKLGAGLQKKHYSPNRKRYSMKNALYIGFLYPLKGNQPCERTTHKADLRKKQKFKIKQRLV
ncbi:hypothetical protein NL449_28325, partial [Klebsiella pneumoniae]|nr:hypothetical protein [Klebsiella pneumoniae]